jgi:8-oxo-dGTP pyrophosphatase MutT (NUDIX family)
MLFFANQTAITITTRTQTIPNGIVLAIDNFEEFLHYHQLIQEGQISVAHLTCWVSDYGAFLDQLRATFELRCAAGGLIFRKNKLLFIKRNGIWDLPKGHQEPLESLPITALREVEEETGVQARIIDPLPFITYHSYWHKDKYVLKQNFWFLMHAASNATLRPQTEEGITKIAWVKPHKLPKIAAKTYPAIAHLLQEKINFVL